VDNPRSISVVTGRVTTALPVAATIHLGKDRFLGVAIADGPLRGLLARAVIVLDPQGKIVYSEMVARIEDEPDYDAALAHLPH